MPIPAIVDALDSVAESLRGEYEPIEGGKFRLKVTGAEDAFASGLKANRDTILAEKTKVDNDLKQWKAAGLTLEEINALKKEREDASVAKAKEEGRFNDLLAEANTKHQGELKTRAEREEFLTQQLSRNLIDAQAIAAITAADGNPKLLMGVLAPRLQMIEEGEGEAKTFVVRVLGPDGKPQMTYKQGKAEYMTIADAVAELKEDVESYGGAFNASGRGGSGATAGGTKNNAAGAKTIKRGDFDKLAPGDRMASIKAGVLVVD